ncbi:hypothetical protein C2E23DRAFT_885818 [Lenzites betulinus]|nr:hypothetical protein C2E23DRAFT_885818 [Lenzites betulinus]
MSLFDLPVEIVERIILSLADDRRSLANCSATCHSLITLCRPSLWSTIVLSYIDSPAQGPLISFGILDINPQIAPYVRSLTLKMVSLRHISLRRLTEGGGIADVVRKACPRTPNLRSLRLQGLCVGSLLDVVALAADIPALETLVLDQVLMSGVWLHDELPAGDSDPALAAISVRNRWNLKSLQISNAAAEIPARCYASLARCLAQFADYISLESLDVRSRHAQAFFLPLLREPGAAVAPVGAALRHLRTSIRDMAVSGAVDPTGRDDIIQLFDALLCCRELRSLSLCYSASGVQKGPTPTGGRGPPPVFPFFLDALAETLGYRGPAPTAPPSGPEPVPFPHFQHLTVEFTTRVDCVLSCSDAFARLASVLTGAEHQNASLREADAPDCGRARRYPAFSALTVRACPNMQWPRFVQGVENDAEHEQTTDGRELLRPMLARFQAEAGMRVDVELLSDKSK